MYINIWYLATCNIVVTFQKIWLIISPLSYILGQLYLENKELLRLLDSQNQALGQRNNQIDNLQREKKNLQRYLEGTYIHSIQQQNEQHAVFYYQCSWNQNSAAKPKAAVFYSFGSCYLCNGLFSILLLRKQSSCRMIAINYIQQNQKLYYPFVNRQ